MGFLHKDLLRIVTCFEYRYHCCKVFDEIQQYVEKTDILWDFYERDMIHDSVFCKGISYWHRIDTINFVSNEYLFVEDYFFHWMFNRSQYAYTFMNGEVFTLDFDDEKEYKLTKSQYKNRQEVYEAFRNYYK